MAKITPRDYTRIAEPAMPAVSPDGTIAFVRKQPCDDTSYTSEVIRLDKHGSLPNSGHDTDPAWGPNGSLAFVRNDSDKRGADLWLQRDDGGVIRLTRTAREVRDVAWAPNGDQLAFVQRCTPKERADGLDIEAPADYERPTPDPRVIDRLVYRGQGRYFDGERNHIYVHNRRNGTTERITDGESDFVGPVFGDANTLFFLRKQGDDTDLSIGFDVIKHNRNTGKSIVVAKAASTARPGTSDRHPSMAATTSNRLAFTYTHGHDDPSVRKTEIRVSNVEGPTRAVTDGLDRTVEEDIGLSWGPDSDEVFFVTPDEGDYVLRRVNVNNGLTETVVKDGHVDAFAANDDLLVFTRSEWEHPGDLFSVPIKGGKVERLTELNRAYLDERAVGEPEEIWFESNGVSVQGWLLLPPNTDPSAQEFPLIVEIHGGPHTMWSMSGTMWHEFQTLAASGYAVFWSNPRGSRGYGQSFARATVGDWGRKTLSDVLAGVDAVIDRPYIDECNVFVTGGSFGGYTVGWAVGHTDRFDAAVAQRGIYDVSLWYGTTDGSKQVDFDFDATPWDDSDTLRRQSPASYVDDVSTPTLILHSESDYRVPICNSELFFAYLKKAGVPTRLVRYPREGHGLSRTGEPAHIVDRLERIRRWFDGYSTHHEGEVVLQGKLSEADRE